MTVAPSGQRIRETVAGFVDEPMSPVAYISLERLEALSGTLAAPSGVNLTLRLDASSEVVRERSL